MLMLILLVIMLLLMLFVLRRFIFFQLLLRLQNTEWNVMKKASKLVIHSLKSLKEMNIKAHAR